MSQTVRTLLWDEPTPVGEGLDWTFARAHTRGLTHCYHDYPARMIPQVAQRLIEMFAPPHTGVLFDPYCGTGTTLVEAMLHGMDAVGTDLNPLARLIAAAKTATPDPDQVDRQIAAFARYSKDAAPRHAEELPRIRGIARLDFWFKPAASASLLAIRNFVDEISDDAVRLFFHVAFSETVRESSNTRSDEFKLYRYDAETLRTFNPDVFGVMLSKLKRNRTGLREFLRLIRKWDPLPTARIYDFDTVEGVPTGTIDPESVDIIVTSPPYGDSATTVAYGQYSRLSAAWLGLAEPEKVDRRLMGGRRCRYIASFPCCELNHAVDHIAAVDEERARDVSAFYCDLRKSVGHVAQLLKPGSHACYVVGNRKVKGVVLPTHLAVRAFFEDAGCDFVANFERSIPNKRMPHRNSPTNAPGIVDTTMLREFIVVVRRRQRLSVSEPLTNYSPSVRRRDTGRCGRQGGKERPRRTRTKSLRRG